MKYGINAKHSILEARHSSSSHITMELNKKDASGLHLEENQRNFIFSCLWLTGVNKFIIISRH